MSIIVVGFIYRDKIFKWIKKHKKIATVISTAGVIITGGGAGILFGPPAAVTYHVAIGGSNSNNGLSEAQAFETITYGLSKLSNGDTLTMHEGTYTPVAEMLLDKDNASYSTESWITIQADTGETVIINGTYCSATSSYTSILNLQQVNWIRITGLIFEHAYAGSITFHGDCHHTRVDNCSILNSSNYAIKYGTDRFSPSYSCAWATIDYNTITNAHCCWNPSFTKVGQEAVSLGGVVSFNIYNNTMTQDHCLNIDIKSGSTQGTVHHNTINTSGGYCIQANGAQYFGGTGIYIDGYTSGCVDVDVYNNYITGNMTAIKVNAEKTSGYVNRIRVYNNVIYGHGPTQGETWSNAGWAMHLGSNGYTSHMYNVSIYCNTILTNSVFTYNGGALRGALGIRQPLTYYHYCRFDNNIFAIDEGAHSTVCPIEVSYIASTAVSTSTLYFDYNTYYRYPGTYSSINIQWSDTRTLTGGGSNSRSIDPGFNDKSTVDLSLTLTSDPVDKVAAGSSYCPSFDYLDVQRPQGTYSDWGAYEFSPNPPDVYQTTVRTNGIDYFTWMGANITASAIDPLIDGFDEVSEYIATWSLASWSSTVGLWNKYNGDGSGTDWTIHTFDIIQIYLTDGVGSITISMTENSDISYLSVRSVYIYNLTANKGYNYTGYFPAATGVSTLSGVAGEINLSTGEVIGWWDTTNYVWRAWIQGFSITDYAIDERDVFFTKVGAKRLFTIGS